MSYKILFVYLQTDFKDKTMVSKELLRQVLYEQRELYKDLGIERNVDVNWPASSGIMVISGVRRCGKSVLMQQIRARQSEQDYYMSFDDDRLIHFSVEDFQLLYDVFMEDFGVQHTFYLDEPQLITGWERFVERLHKHGNKVYVTGSNAFMLSKELGTLLTGRHLTQELYPMSLSEYMSIKGFGIKPKDFYTTEGRAMLTNLQSGFLKEGGFPQYLSTGDPRYLRELYNDIIFRDIVVRHKLPSEKPIKEVAYFLASNFTHKFTYQSIAKATKIKSPETINAYIGYLEECYLVGVLTKYDYKVGEQIKSPRKAYFIDNGLVSQVGFTFSENLGKKLENAVYVELRRREMESYYFHDGNECDFIIRKNGIVEQALQVAVSLKNPETRKREEEGLLAAMKVFGLREGTIITLDETEENNFSDGGVIHVIPFYRWCLQ